MQGTVNKNKPTTTCEQFLEKARREKLRSAQKNLECQHKAVAKHTAKNLNVSRDVAKYAETNLEVHTGVIAKCTQQHSEVHRSAIADWHQHLDINKSTVPKYALKHPEFHMAAFANYVRQQSDMSRAPLLDKTPLKNIFSIKMQFD